MFFLRQCTARLTLRSFFGRCDGVFVRLVVAADPVVRAALPLHEASAVAARAHLPLRLLGVCSRARVHRVDGAHGVAAVVRGHRGCGAQRCGAREVRVGGPQGQQF